VKSVIDGDILLFPTDTVVGIGCRYDAENSIARLREIKGIKQTVPFAVLVSSPEQLSLLKIRRSKISNLLISRFWPGGLTIVMTSENKYPCCGDGNAIGVRMPDSDLLREIIETGGIPLVATSANLHGKPSPRKLEDVDKLIKDQVDCIIDFPVQHIGLPSTVVKLEAGEPRILREGAVPSAEIMEMLKEAV